MEQIKIIINADDLGYTKIVNENISMALEKRLITSATIMANTEYWDDVECIVAKNPQASFGIHLNLTKGPALTNSSTLYKYGIVDKNNCFTKAIQTINIIPKELHKAILEELIAQVELVKEHNIPISHIDGHHHVHTINALAADVISVLKKYGIDKYRRKCNIRSTTNNMQRYINVNNEVTKQIYSAHIIYIITSLFSRIKNKINDFLWRTRFKFFGGKTTHYFCSYFGVINYLKQGNRFKNDCIIECMCHPGANLYKEEFQLIQDRELDKYQQVTYISYNDIH